MIVDVLSSVLMMLMLTRQEWWRAERHEYIVVVLVAVVVLVKAVAVKGERCQNFTDKTKKEETLVISYMKEWLTLMVTSGTTKIDPQMI